MGITATHTYVELEVSQSTYNEIAEKLRAAGYDHCFMEDGAIDMHGLAVTVDKNFLAGVAALRKSASY